ncbi:hypothetical protein [Streptomyces anulatus]|uniref:hypothetical protein n=1 Tax=Streptomyces anulatus TaxID=1892 RepID=UPI00386ED21A|nr:hypothetical protein OG575_39005 [Streptomyces anulatus]
MRSLLSTAEAPGQSVHRCVLFEHERNRRATESSARAVPVSVSDLLVLLREALPEFLGILSAAVVTTAAAAALRTARTARLRRREPDPTEPPPARE